MLLSLLHPQRIHLFQTTISLWLMLINFILWISFLYSNEQSPYYLKSEAYIQWTFLLFTFMKGIGSFHFILFCRLTLNRPFFYLCLKTEQDTLLTFINCERTERALFCPPSPGPGWYNLALVQWLLTYPFVLQVGYQLLGSLSAEAGWSMHKTVYNIMNGFSRQPLLLPARLNELTPVVHCISDISYKYRSLDNISINLTFSVCTYMQLNIYICS